LGASGLSELLQCDYCSLPYIGLNIGNQHKAQSIPSSWQYCSYDIALSELHSHPQIFKRLFCQCVVLFSSVLSNTLPVRGEKPFL